MTQPDLDHILSQQFGMSGFRRGQRETLESILAGHDTLAVMPTGGGKSLCYQMPSVVTQGWVVVVSPLIALMKDQVRVLKGLGFNAGAVYSGQTVAEKKEVFSQLFQNKQFVLFLSPERVQSEGFKSWIQKAENLKFFAIDEAHCVSQWGPDFRNEYYQLSILRKLRPEIPMLALTATATPRVLSDISKNLGLNRPHRFVFGFYRPNIYIEIKETTDDAEKWSLLNAAIAAQPEGRVIVYCGTRKQAEELSQYFSKNFEGVGHYHAGLSDEERKDTQDKLSAGELRILFATNAFGMGIDYPNVRLVVHYSMPANIESYYQEIGRAGRDGNPSKALLLYSKKDKGLQVYFIQSSDADAFTRSKRWDALKVFTHFLEGAECRHEGILTYFKDKDRIDRCGHCDICDPSKRLYVEFSKDLGSSRKPKKSRSSHEKTLSSGALDDSAKKRAQRLKEWRVQYARTHDIAAFIVFSDKTMNDLAAKNPRTLEDLKKVYGFGDKKAEWIGEELIRELRSLDG